MRTLVKLISWLGLLLTIAPAFGVFYGQLTFADHTYCMLTGMVLWFVTAPFSLPNPKNA
jgi:hypothetical protein